MNTILKSLAAIAVVGAVAGGATFAYFSNEAKITGNTFRAGTVDLKVDGNPISTEQDWVDNFTNTANPFATLVPGKTDHQVIDIKNVGTIDSYTTIQLNKTAGNEALEDKLNFKIYYKEGDAQGNGGTWSGVLAQGPLSAFTGTYTLGDLAVNNVGNVKIEWTLDASAGNDLQGAGVILDAVFGLEQNR